MRTWISIACALALGAACGGGSTETETETSVETETETEGGTGGETPRPPLPDVPFDQLTPEQKGQFMAERVLPEMRTMFQEFDAERFAQFDCTTCHGANAMEVSFRMPNGLSPLDPAQMQTLFTSPNPMPVFMRERVWPRMSELLREPQFDQATGQGFSCFNCHERAGAPAAK
jgi:hypothetical protein